MSATGREAKALKEAEVEEAILRQAQACHSEAVRVADRRFNKAHASTYALMWWEARKYAEHLVKRGHCPCHLVVNCPNA